MGWTKMGTVPNPVTDANGDPYSGAVLKMYDPGTTTAISIAIDKNGSSPQATFTSNAEGKWEVSGNEVIPYIDRECKWGIFANATDATANTPFYMGPFDNVPQSETSPQVTTVSVKDYGAVGDGVTDDTAAIQLFLNHISSNNLSGVLEDGSTYIVSDNLYIYGGASLSGRATINLTSNPTRTYWFICGAASYGGTSNPCTGTFKDFTLDINSPANIEVALYFGSAKGLVIDNVTVKSNGKCSNKAFSQLPNASYIPSPTSENISILNCTVSGAASGDGEVLGLELCDRFTIDNFRCIDGFAYDDLGIHKCNNGTITNCHIRAYDGRIYASDSDDIKIIGNTIDYASTSEGMGIYVGSESTAAPNVCKNVLVSGNTVYYRSSITGFGYGIRCEAGRNVRITDNVLINESAQTAANIYVQNQTLSGWVDPTGIDPNNNPQSHSVTVKGNIIDGSIVVLGGDNVKITGNEADSYDVESPASVNVFDGNVSKSATITDNQFDSANRNAAKKLFTRVVPNTGSSYVKGTEFHSAIGSTLFYCQRAVVVTHFIISSTTAISAGFYQVELLLNGTKTGATKTFNGGDKTQVNFIASAGTKNYIADVGDTLEVQAKTNNGTPTPNDVVIDVYGFELT